MGARRLEFTIAIVVAWSTAAIAAAEATTVTTAIATALGALALAATAPTTIAATVATACALAAGTGFAFTYAGEPFCAGSLGGGLHYVAARRLASATPDGLAAHGDGFAFFTGLGAKALDQIDAQGAELIAHRRIDPGVAAGDTVARFTCQRCQPTHEGAANTQNMNVHGVILMAASSLVFVLDEVQNCDLRPWIVREQLLNM